MGKGGACGCLDRDLYRDPCSNSHCGIPCLRKAPWIESGLHLISELLIHGKPRRQTNWRALGP